MNPVLFFLTQIIKTEDFLNQLSPLMWFFCIWVLSRTSWSSMTPLLGFLHTGVDHTLFSNPIRRDCLSLLQLEGQAPPVPRRASSQLLFIICVAPQCADLLLQLPPSVTEVLHQHKPAEKEPQKHPAAWDCTAGSLWQGPQPSSCSFTLTELEKKMEKRVGWD